MSQIHVQFGLPFAAPIYECVIGALKGGGGGTFGVVTKLTLKVHELPELFGVAMFRAKTIVDDAYRTLLNRFVDLYRGNLLNEHWGEIAHFRADNVLDISMISQGLTTEQIQSVWQPFVEWVRHSPNIFSLEPGVFSPVCLRGIFGIPSGTSKNFMSFF